MEKGQHKIEDFAQLLAIADSHLNILEEEIDVQVQKSYFNLLQKLSKDHTAYIQLTKQYLENINDLFVFGFKIGCEIL